MSATNNVPRLIAPGVRSFMDFTLRNCRQIKDSYTTWAVNLGLTIFLIITVGIFLYFKYKGKPTKEEEHRKKIEGQEYIMRKLGTHVSTRQMAEQMKLNNGSLTGLPMWDKSILIPGIKNQ